jgi:DNA-binding HxlR family transcriptional regulator
MESAPVSLAKVDSCPLQYILALNDTMNVLNGKWKIPIIASMIHEKKRFRDIQLALPHITARMLSKELRELEANSIVVREISNTYPAIIQYTLTPSAYLLKRVLDKMIEWGIGHRHAVMSPKPIDPC